MVANVTQSQQQQHHYTLDIKRRHATIITARRSRGAHMLGPTAGAHASGQFIDLCLVVCSYLASLSGKFGLKLLQIRLKGNLTQCG